LQSRARTSTVSIERWTTGRKKVSLPYLFNKVAQDEPINMLTCSDYPTAHFQEQAWVDTVPVGDSLENKMLGNESTLPVTMDDMVWQSALERQTPC